MLKHFRLAGTNDAPLADDIASIDNRKDFFMTNKIKNAPKTDKILRGFCIGSLFFMFNSVFVKSEIILVVSAMWFLITATYGIFYHVNFLLESVSKDCLHEYKKKILSEVHGKDTVFRLISPALLDIDRNQMRASWYEELFGMIEELRQCDGPNINNENAVDMSFSSLLDKSGRDLENSIVTVSKEADTTHEVARRTHQGSWKI